MEPSSVQGRRDFWPDFGLAVVTLGFYMPYWLWSRNEELRDATGQTQWMSNTALLAIGAVAATFTPWLILGAQGNLTGVMVVGLGICLFCAGAFLLARNGEAAAEALGVEWSFPPWLFGVGLAAAFLAVNWGNSVPEWTVRGPALALMASTPFYFHRVHEGLENVREARAERAPGSTPDAIAAIDESTS